MNRRVTRFFTSSNPVSVCCNQMYLSGDRHDSDCTMLRDFPIQGGGRIPWWLAELAYVYYAEHYHGQSLERLAERGGFGMVELISFLRREDVHDASWFPFKERDI